MLEKGRISAFQLGIMMYPTVLGTGFLTLPTITAQYAKNDLWLTGIFASFMGLITVYVVTRLHELYPKQTLIQYSEHILGKIPGKLVGFVFFIFSVDTAGDICRQYADFVKSCFLFKTPLLLIISSMILLCAFAVRGGAEVLARCAIIFTPIFVLPIFILLLLMPDLDAKNIFPIMSHGIVPVIRGTLMPQAWVCEFFMMTFFLPCLVNPEKSRKWGLLSLSTVIVSLIYVNLISLCLFGPDTGNKTYPILTAFRYIGIGHIFENLEALLLAMWVVGNFIKIGVFYYATVLSFAQSLNLSDYRPVVFPLGMLMVVFGFWDLPNFSKLSSQIIFVSPFSLPTFLLLIPLLLLIVAVFRKNPNPKSG